MGGGILYWRGLSAFQSFIWLQARTTTLSLTTMACGREVGLGNCAGDTVSVPEPLNCAAPNPFPPRGRRLGDVKQMVKPRAL